MSLTLAPLVTQLKAAAEPTRLRLLAVCAAGELTVGELTRIVGQSQPRVSRHLKKLCDAGLLLRFRERHYVYYRVPPAGAARRLVSSLLASLSDSDAKVSGDMAVFDRVQRERAVAAQAVLENSTVESSIRDALLDDDKVRQVILRMTNLDAIGDLLDIGTGAGRILALFGHHARSAVGIDISSEMLLVARSNVHAAGLNSVIVRHGDMYRLPYDDASFDTLTVDQVLTQAEHPARVLAEAGRLLKPAGQLVVVDVVPHASAGDDEAAARIENWVKEAGLVPADFARLQGDAVDVLISVARHTQDKEDEAA